MFTIYFILVTFWIFRPPIWGDFGRIFALVPSIHQGTRKRHSSELIETFSKWSNNPRKLEITVSRHIWKISPLTSSRFTFQRFWPNIRNKFHISDWGPFFLFLDLDTCKLLRSYLRPTGVGRNIVWVHPKKSPFDPQPIPWHLDQNRGHFEKKSHISDWGPIFRYGSKTLGNCSGLTWDQPELIGT